MEISFENMCRTCMNDDGTMFSVFSVENQFQGNQSYAEMLMACFAVKIYAGDGLPEIICQQCKKQLLVSYSFKQQTERSDATLREITKNPTIEFIKEEIREDEYNELDDILQIEYRNEFNSIEGMGTNSQSTTIKSEVNDFELTAEFLNDDIVVEEVEELEEKYVPDDFGFSSIQDINLIRQKDFIGCMECGLRFKTAIELRKHKRVHGRNYACELCGREFRSSHGLGYHLKIHKGIKNYVCHYENCNKRFRLKQALQKHLSIHTNEKNHLCSLCGKTYSTYDALHYHIRAHKGERPYLCMHCGKTFKQSCHLKTHMWVHSGIKPHVCKKCGKCYTSGHQLKKHLRKYCSTTPEPVPIKTE